VQRSGSLTLALSARMGRFATRASVRMARRVKESQKGGDDYAPHRFVCSSVVPNGTRLFWGRYTRHLRLSAAAPRRHAGLFSFAPNGARASAGTRPSCDSGRALCRNGMTLECSGADPSPQRGQHGWGGLRRAASVRDGAWRERESKRPRRLRTESICLLVSRP
jgi:hypothetical protein